MKAHPIKFLAFASFALVLASASQAQNETYLPTPNAFPHLKKAESLALGLKNQAYWNVTGETVNGSFIPHNLYGGTFANGSVQWGSGYWAYNPKTRKNYWKVTTPWQNNTVCGVFVSKMLESAYGFNWLDYSIPGEDATNSPNARLYSKAIENGVAFWKVGQVGQLTQGDIISVDYKTSPDSDANSGHVMIFRHVKSSFLTTPDSEDSNVYRVWRLSIVDSTSQPHDTLFDGQDSRKIKNVNGANYEMEGAGIGEFRIITNQAGDQILGWSWGSSPSVYSKSYKNMMNNSKQNQTDKPISMGRLLLLLM